MDKQKGDQKWTIGKPRVSPLRFLNPLMKVRNQPKSARMDNSDTCNIGHKAQNDDK
jgi:hypothetical protein